MAFGTATIGQLRAHGLAVVTGFFALTIVGYAVQFFAVTSGRFRGARERATLGTIATLAGGVLCQTGGALLRSSFVTRGWSVVALGGAAYAYLLGRRLLQ